MAGASGAARCKHPVGRSRRSRNAEFHRRFYRHLLSGSGWNTASGGLRLFRLSRTRLSRRSVRSGGIMTNRSAIVSILVAVSATPLLLAQTQATLSIELKQSKAPVSPALYGLMTEEINYSYDGGLYAELIRNRTFRSDWTGVLNWYAVEERPASAKLSVDNKTGLSAALTTSANHEDLKTRENV